MFVNSDFSELLSLFNDFQVRYMVVSARKFTRSEETRWWRLHFLLVWLGYLCGALALNYGEILDPVGTAFVLVAATILCVFYWIASEINRITTDILILGWCEKRRQIGEQLRRLRLKLKRHGGSQGDVGRSQGLRQRQFWRIAPHAGAATGDSGESPQTPAWRPG